MGPSAGAQSQDMSASGNTSRCVACWAIHPPSASGKRKVGYSTLSLSPWYAAPWTSHHLPTRSNGGSCPFTWWSTDQCLKCNLSFGLEGKSRQLLCSGVGNRNNPPLTNMHHSTPALEAKASFRRDFLGAGLAADHDAQQTFGSSNLRPI